MKKPATLCIVDMQPEFVAAMSQYIIHHITLLIQRAKTKRAGIVVLEYQRCGRTLYQIREALEGYKNVITCKKKNDDGSIEFLDACDHEKFNKKQVIVCGVNTDMCITDTALGIKQHYPKAQVEVVADACSTDNGLTCHRIGLSRMKRRGILVIGR